MEDMEIIEKYEVNKKSPITPRNMAICLHPACEMYITHLWVNYLNNIQIKIYAQFCILFFLTLSWIVPSTIKIIGKHDF